jgi:hypothetical protein
MDMLAELEVQKAKWKAKNDKQQAEKEKQEDEWEAQRSKLKAEKEKQAAELELPQLKPPTLESPQLESCLAERQNRQAAKHNAQVRVALTVHPPRLQVGTAVCPLPPHLQTGKAMEVLKDGHRHGCHGQWQVVLVRAPSH